MGALDSTPAVPGFAFFVNELVMRTFLQAPARPCFPVLAAIVALGLASVAQARTELATLSPPQPAAPVAVTPPEQPGDAAPDGHPGEDEGPATISDLRARLDDSDRITALNALKIALDEVGDGGTFVWSKHHRQLKGIIRPTSAFRDADGRVCRHVIYALKLADYTKQIETIACRQSDGRWRL